MPHAEPPPSLCLVVIDDDLHARRVVEAILMDRGHRIRSFDSARGALEWLSKDEVPIDAVVCDLNMPEINGRQFCQALRDNRGPGTPPLLIMSSSDSVEEIAGALECGAEHYVRKPFAPGELVATVERMARRVRVRLQPEERTWIGDYRVRQVLGKGGSGVVYRAQRAGMPDVALKILASRSGDLEDLLRFRREFEVLKSLRHPNVARFVDSGRADDSLYLAMELVKGTPLSDRLARAPLSPLEVSHAGAGIAGALSYLHRRGLVHRDVKPANVVLSSKGRAVLIDFGLTRRPDDLTLTNSSWVVGTPAYMAPEISMGGAPSAASDVFALGVTLLEALVGGHPLVNPTISAIELAHAIARGELPLAATLAPSAPSALTCLIDQATELEPAHRPTAEDFAQALANIPSTLRQERIA